jgi:hypothetical protein
MRKEHHFLSIFPLNAAYPGHQLKIPFTEKFCFTNILTSSGGRASMPNFLNHSHQNEAFYAQE